MGWFWADSEVESPAVVASLNCPVSHKSSAAGTCPVAKSPPPVCPVSKKSAPVCPVKHNDSEINPLNNMPNLPSTKFPGQKIDLPTERVISTIPRGEDESEGYWEYPLPQQMFNAMMRKGKGDGIEEDAVESMVDVHNFLNEAAWAEILDWERPHFVDGKVGHSNGMYDKFGKKIEDGSEKADNSKVDVRLLKFTGRPDDMSPRARTYLVLSKLFPSTFNSNPPFDRHDWTVLRKIGQDEESGKKKWKQVRYVIDYYGGPDTEEGLPTFYLDVRPALDDFGSIYDRWRRWTSAHTKTE